MPGYKNSLVIVFGGIGCLKTTISELYVSLSCNTVTVNRDCVAIGFSSGQSASDAGNVLRRLIFRKKPPTAPKDKKLAYEAIISIAKSNLESGKTVLLEGNFAQWFSDEIMREFLKPTEEELRARTYDVCLLYITCNNPNTQFERIFRRNASRDASIMNKDVFLREVAERRRMEESAIKSLPDGTRLLQIDTTDYRTSEQVAAILPSIYSFVTANMLPEKAKVQELRAPTPNIDFTQSPFADARTEQMGSEGDGSGVFDAASSRPSSDVTPDSSPEHKPAKPASTPSSGSASVPTTPERTSGMPVLNLGERPPFPMMLSAFQSTIERDTTRGSQPTASESRSAEAGLQQHRTQATTFSPCGS